MKMNIRKIPANLIQSNKIKKRILNGMSGISPVLDELCFQNLGIVTPGDDNDELKRLIQPQ